MWPGQRIRLTGLAAAWLFHRRVRLGVRCMAWALLAACAAGPFFTAVAQQALAASAAAQQLAAEVRDKGWICYAARSSTGDWDLFVCRPDGSAVRNLTATPEFNEFAPQFSRDGRKLLYRRLPRGENIDGNRYGAQGDLVIANSDGSAPHLLHGQALTWASWSPNGRQIACLTIKGIFFFDAETLQQTRRLNRKGFFQQLTWSPDGQWLVGVANSYGTGWSIARMNVETGEASAVNRVDCCTPDWFPDSKQVVFSWRPPGQKGNNGYGWTQLWMADAEGKVRQLVYGEDGRHVYGGHVSPDGKYALFTGNLREDGDPENAGAPMGLMRVADAPIIGGESKELRALHPNVNDGPVLTLPAGLEPCWTFAEIFKGGEPVNPSNPSDTGTKELASELHDQGWIVYSAQTKRGDWDLFVMRPDGSERHSLTDTPDFNEAGPRFSPDGKRLLYYRLPKAEPVNMTYGTRELVISDADGRNPVVYGSGFPWASWGPDSAQIACLKPEGIQIIDVATRKLVRQLPRRGIAQQLVWSPDGRWFLGTANGLGPYWNIGRLDANTGDINVVSETDRYNCTPDWAPDSQHAVYARGIIPEQGGRAEMWLAAGDGKQREMIFAEGGRHIYGACVSPDGKYCLFTRSTDDFGNDGDVRNFTMAVMRHQDAPMIGDQSAALRKRFPDAKTGPWLDLGPGWEPHWKAAK